jgi:hypothetical protein
MSDDADSSQRFDVEMNELSGTLPFVAHRRRLGRLQERESGQAYPPQHRRHRRARHLQPMRNLPSSQSLPPKGDGSRRLDPAAPADAVDAAAIHQPCLAALRVATQPLVNRGIAHIIGCADHPLPSSLRCVVRSLRLYSPGSSSLYYEFSLGVLLWGFGVFDQPLSPIGSRQTTPKRNEVACAIRETLCRRPREHRSVLNANDPPLVPGRANTRSGDRAEDLWEADRGSSALTALRRDAPHPRRQGMMSGDRKRTAGVGAAPPTPRSFS